MINIQRYFLFTALWIPFLPSVFGSAMPQKGDVSFFEESREKTYVINDFEVFATAPEALRNLDFRGAKIVTYQNKAYVVVNNIPLGFLTCGEQESYEQPDASTCDPMISPRIASFNATNVTSATKATIDVALYTNYPEKQFFITEYSVIDPNTSISNFVYTGCKLILNGGKAYIDVAGLPLIFQVCQTCERKLYSGVATDIVCDTIDSCYERPLVLRVKTTNATEDIQGELLLAFAENLSGESVQQKAIEIMDADEQRKEDLAGVSKLTPVFSNNTNTR